MEFRLTLAGRNGYRRIALYSPESSQLLWEDTGERVDLAWQDAEALYLPDTVDTFAEPDRLDLGRANANQHVSFGGGVHHCLGNALAKQNTGRFSVITLRIIIVTARCTAE